MLKENLFKKELADFPNPYGLNSGGDLQLLTPNGIKYPPYLNILGLFLQHPKVVSPLNVFVNSTLCIDFHKHKIHSVHKSHATNTINFITSLPYLVASRLLVSPGSASASSSASRRLCARCEAGTTATPPALAFVIAATKKTRHFLGTTLTAQQQTNCKRKLCHPECTSSTCFVVAIPLMTYTHSAPN